jgi:hypothetical protein
MGRKLVLLLVVWATTVSPLATARAAGPSERAATAGGIGVTPDFDGDGFADLAVGVPFEDIGSLSGAGAVNVLYGGASGLSSAGDQVWSQDGAGVKDTSEEGDSFGGAIAAGDFDADGFADLAVGVPGEDLGIGTDAGAVAVLHGSPAGLTANDQLWTLGITPWKAANGDRYGWSLAAGDFDDDGFVDLAVGAPGKDGLGHLAPKDIGVVHVLYGSSEGLSASRNRVWPQGFSQSEDVSEEGDRFGWALVAGDFNNSGTDDLAVGVPFEDVRTPTIADAGAVHLLFGVATMGITGGGDWFRHQGEGGLTTTDPAEEGDRFGWALAAGDFGGSAGIDIVVGVPYEDFGATKNAGAINVVKASSLGGLYHVTQGTEGVEGAVEAGDLFGWSVASADFGRDPAADVAVGVPGEDIGSIADAGAVNVLYSRGSGVVAGGDQVWSQDTGGIADGSETGDLMGRTLTAAEFGLGGLGDLAVGVPSEDLGGVGAAGGVAILYASNGGTGLSDASDQLWSQLGDVEGSAEGFDAFGSALAGAPALA